jgi:hypothetical protein
MVISIIIMVHTKILRVNLGRILMTLLFFYSALNTLELK